MATPIDKLVFKITILMFIFFLIFHNIPTSSFRSKQLSVLRIIPSPAPSEESQCNSPSESRLGFFQSKGRPKDNDVQVKPKYSIKPIVYIFPQYHAIPENDRIWGPNFTEWDNVRKVTHNAYGLETIRPHESVGFYNGLDLSTRKRQGQFIRDSGFYGAVYHHYWFSGKPVMDGVIRAMLADGEPNTPFMLNWANEPWTARWDGLDSSETFIAQAYGGPADWRAHFDWLLPFFRHPQYIRSEGRIQFMVYRPDHIGRIGPHMFAAWRQWAVEEGLGGMDIIETRWYETQWNQGMPDAVSEFHPHVAGPYHERHSSTDRLTRVYHRGTLVCWDATPRHVNDGKGSPNPTCHYKSWQFHLVQMFQRIKSDPNPIGAENFFFVNALNEWGEGNAMEPSAQFGDGYGKAMKAALAISEKLHPWPDALRTKDMESLKQQQNASEESRPDVCVLVQTSPHHASDRIYRLENMLRSLREQRNQKWRALVYQQDTSWFGDLENIVLDTLDPRIKAITLPEDVRNAYRDDDDAGYTAVDWIMGNLNETDTACASARYLLLTGGGNTYAPNAFDIVWTEPGVDIVSSEPDPDVVGLNFESKKTVMGEHIQWDARCTRLENSSRKLCERPSPTSDALDITATFINLSRLQNEARPNFSAFTTSHPRNQGEAFLHVLLNGHGWKWLQTPSNQTCEVMHNPAFSSCQTSGNIWVDSPNDEESGCYSTMDLLHHFGNGLEKLDLQYFRENGYCMRYKQGEYEETMR